jgi:hypothetical protein
MTAEFGGSMAVLNRSVRVAFDSASVTNLSPAYMVKAPGISFPFTLTTPVPHAIAGLISAAKAETGRIHTRHQHIKSRSLELWPIWFISSKGSSKGLDQLRAIFP